MTQGGGPIYTIASWLVPLVIAIVAHEVAHGLAARALGDTTAARMGRLTLNPLKHVDPVGTVALPLLLAVAQLPVFGWAKPVPVRPGRLRRPRLDMMLVALAGPGMNIVLALAATVTIGAAVAVHGGVPGGGTARFVIDNLFHFLLINVFLGVFNLIPLPPFDGGHVVEGLLPRGAVPAWRRIGRYAIVVLLALLVVAPMLWPDANVVARAVGPVAGWVVDALLGVVGLRS